MAVITSAIVESIQSESNSTQCQSEFTKSESQVLKFQVRIQLKINVYNASINAVSMH